MAATTNFSFVPQKKAQIHMTETIAVLFIFFILILFGLIFYAQFQKSAFKEKAEELLQKRATETMLKVLFLPELICSERSLTEDNCFELAKVQAVVDGNLLEGGRGVDTEIDQEKRDYYFSIFSYATIKVQQLSVAADENDEPYVLYDHPLPKFTKSEPTFFVVALKEAPDTYHFASLAVTVYS
ncbi:MAG TPA: hypothetical protein VJC21_02710 [Candidatus Nanoarchaeia archaeon]|nr:hypothetical protein [Candidatus Nanoarchaeia archaeon]